MADTIELVVIIVLCGALSLALQLHLKSRARAIGLVDVPLGRKKHAAITPMTGGLAMFLAFAFAMLAEPAGWPVTLWPLLGLALLVGCGVLDDLMHLPAMLKLVVQTVAAVVILVPGTAVVTQVGGVPWLGEITLGWLAWPLSVVFVVGMVNAFNMIDGIDGLATGTAVIALAWFAVTASALGHGGSISVFVAGVALAAATSVLVFNMRHPWRARASVFLGDAGSMFLGALIAWVVLYVASPAAAPVDREHLPLAVCAWIVAVPLCDAGSVIVRRIIRGTNPMRADGTHLHHVLRGAGLSVEWTVNVILLASFATGAVGVGLWYVEVPEVYLTTGLLVPLAVHTAALALIARPVPWRPGTIRARDAVGGSSAS